jgi:hypothetical protein
MNEEQKKRVTKWLGECWHEHDFEQTRIKSLWYCKHCGKDLYLGSGRFIPLRTFTEPADFFACFDRLVELGEWEEFDNYTMDVWSASETKDDYMVFALSRTDTGHFRLCVMVSEWLKEKE